MCAWVPSKPERPRASLVQWDSHVFLKWQGQTVCLLLVRCLEQKKDLQLSPDFNHLVSTRGLLSTLGEVPGPSESHHRAYTQVLLDSQVLKQSFLKMTNAINLEMELNLMVSGYENKCKQLTSICPKDLH